MSLDQGSRRASGLALTISSYSAQVEPMRSPSLSRSSVTFLDNVHAGMMNSDILMRGEGKYVI